MHRVPITIGRDAKGTGGSHVFAYLHEHINDTEQAKFKPQATKRFTCILLTFSIDTTFLYYPC